MKILQFIFLVIISQNILQAQIAAPNFRCVKRDTLIWDVPTVSCGAVQSYTIYSARNINGPYQVLTTINNTAQTRYFHNNTEGGSWYYYMETNANCAGQARLQSDTLDNQPPTLTSVLTLNVVDNKTVEVRWRRNPSPEVRGYIIYKKTSTGLIPIASVPNRDSVRYLDTKATPFLKSEEYQVLAVDACGNTSLFDVNHKTILVKASQSKCEQIVTLNWNLYQNWTNPIAKQEIWVGTNGRIPTLFASLGAKDSVYLYKNAKDKTKYTFYVRAIESITNIVSKSNDTTLTADVLEPIKELILKNVSVNTKNQVELTWKWNANAKIDSFLILRHRYDTASQVIYRAKANQPLDEEIYYTDTKVVPSSRRFWYTIQTTDECKVVKQSNEVSTVFLSAFPQSTGKNRIRWEPLDFANGIVTSYQLIRIVRGASTNIGTPIDTSAIREYVDLTSVGEPEICYRIGANYRYKLADGTYENATSYSQTICLSQFTNVFVPNAFTPGGKNPEFKPVFTFSENIINYTMIILDRWGSVLFKTDNPRSGWDGTRNGADLPQGTYSYIVRVRQASGGLVEEKGVLMLIR